MTHKLEAVINRAEHFEINMERADCAQYEGTIYRFDLEGGIDEWYVDGEQMVEISVGGCVTAKLARDYVNSIGCDEHDLEVEIYFAKLVPLNDEDMQ